MISLLQLLLILRARINIFLATLILTVLTTTVVTLLAPKTYTATASVIVNLKDEQGSFGSAAFLQPFYLETQSDIITSRKVALKVVKELKLSEGAAVRDSFEAATHGKVAIEEWLADRVVKNVDVQTSHSNVVQIGYSANDPRFAAVVANAFAQAYIDTNLELRVEPARQSAQWFSGQLKQLRENLEAVQTKLTAYQNAHGIVSIDEKGDLEGARHAELSSQLMQAQAATYQSLSQQKQAEEFLARGAPLESLPEVFSNTFVLALRSNLLSEEAKLRDFETQYGKNHPRYQRQYADVETLREKLNVEIKKVIAAASNAHKLNLQREAEVRAALAAQKGKVMSLKERHDELSVLQRDVESAQSAYDDASKRYRQTNLESQVSKTNVAVLNSAIEPLSSSKPKVALNIALSFFIGSMLGAAGVFLLEMFDRRVRTGQDLAQALGIPLLVTLSKDEKTSIVGRWLKARLLRIFAPAGA